MPLVLGVDSSTQATKVEIRDADDGRLVASGRAPHPPTTPPCSEQQPDAWWQALLQAMRQAGRHDIAAMAVAGQQHGLVALDADRRVLRPAKLWNDTESAAEAEALLEQLGPVLWAQACGSVPVASFTVTKLAWLKNHEPETFARLTHVLLPHDWLTFRLTGRLVTDRGDASGTGYWSPGEGRWRPDLLALVEGSVDWIPRLPEVLSPTETAGSVATSPASELGLGSGEVLVGAGTGDNMAAALGVGLRAGDVAISLGTSGTVYAVCQRPTADPSGAVAGFADATGRFLPLVCTLNATKVSDAFARILGVDREAFDALALDASPGADGLVLLPYLDGERTPNRPNATGVLSGLRSAVSREQVARAAIEGVVCGLLDGLDALTAAGVPVREGRVLLVGGGARSPAYQRVLTDLIARPVLVPEASEHVAVGACIQAAAVLHDRVPEEVAAEWQSGAGHTVEPNLSVDSAAVRAAYAAARD
jgi:xylulokinase